MGDWLYDRCYDCDYNDYDEWDSNDLQRALEENDVEGLKKALREGCDPNEVIPPEPNFLPLQKACVFGGRVENCVALVKVLLEADASVFVSNRGDTALHTACSIGPMKDDRVVDMLCRAGADPNATDSEGFSPLHHAVQNDSIVLVKALLRWGADLHHCDFYGGTVLHRVAESCMQFPEIAQYLVEAGVDQRAVDADGDTAYEKALRIYPHGSCPIAPPPQKPTKSAGARAADDIAISEYPGVN